jgi:C4-dicarboxylate-specific signal transduction histidine kinase
MKPDASDKDPAFPVMAMDILSNVLSRADNPGDLGTCLTEEVRDLTGARCVLLIQCLSTPTVTAHRVVSVNPLRLSEWAESSAVNRLYEVVHHVPAAQLWRGEEPSAVAGLLRQEGFELSMVFPLNAGEFRVGAMLVLGLPDEEHITSVLNLLNNLSAIVSLVLRNAILYEKQEQLIQERTAELRDNNEKLAMELIERKRAEEALDRLNEELEQRVTQRTTELEEKNKELDRMNKLFVGRELRMVELKKIIRELEERLP